MRGIDARVLKCVRYYVEALGPVAWEAQSAQESSTRERRREKWRPSSKPTQLTNCFPNRTLWKRLLCFLWSLLYLHVLLYKKSKILSYFVYFVVSTTGVVFFLYSKPFLSLTRKLYFNMGVGTPTLWSYIFIVGTLQWCRCLQIKDWKSFFYKPSH